MRSRSVFLIIVSISSLFVIDLLAPMRSSAAPQSDVPAWLRAHVAEGEGQIAQVVLQRARALYLQKVSEGAVEAMANWGTGSTSSANSVNRFVQFLPVMVAGVI